MNKYLTTLTFYVVSCVIIYVLNMISPGQQDGGLGFGGVATMLLVLVVLVLTVINIYKGFKNKEHFLLAGIHLLILLVMVTQLFL
jgi:hypothetical protein